MQALLDRQAITDRIHDYARSMDRLDGPLGKSCFHEDAIADYGEQMFVGGGHEFVDMCMKVHPAFAAHAHQFSNIRIWLDGPDKARSETYCDVTLRRIGEDGTPYDIRNLGRYVDNWEKREGEWRIARRRYLVDMDQSGPNAGTFETTGKRDRTDPSYFGQ
ncbi:hypothetical protein NSU_2052 [Novosphingobium pentaromativorans US6-1]|uniref:SnoaL-like domain-containing protein n=1 Tax=Novosphingobium pentaromativorans US6-1 TaxID=1088721 RepID=G6ECI1_9SPHN|nr:hypothetical protein NSU_2052 [Novosphingobium pentaromativorans US6-1]